MDKEYFSCSDAKKIDMVEWLASLGHHTIKINRKDYWYLSPFRNEKNASFKVNRKLNIWYDHGIGEGCDIIDLGTRYFHCSISELLMRFKSQSIPFSFHPPVKNIESDFSTSEEKIKIIECKEINDSKLIQYLHSRSIPLSTAKKYCEEIDFELHGKKYKAIGFKNDASGYELRNKYFKGSSSPKTFTLIENNNAENLFVFEGFFDFLSFRSMQFKKSRSQIEVSKQHENYLILNSLFFFDKSKNIMQQFKQIHLYLDHDNSSKLMLEKLKQWQLQYIDHCKDYEHYKDLNEYLINERDHTQKQSLRLRNRL